MLSIYLYLYTILKSYITFNYMYVSNYVWYEWLCVQMQTNPTDFATILGTPFLYSKFKGTAAIIAIMYSVAMESEA